MNYRLPKKLKRRKEKNRLSSINSAVSQENIDDVFEIGTTPAGSKDSVGDDVFEINPTPAGT